MVDLEGDRVAPGCQVLLAQQRGQAGQDLQEGQQHQHHPAGTPSPPTQPHRAAAASPILTHRRAEVEPLQACEDTMPMKALEVSENFLMSTGLGTLQGEGAQVGGHAGNHAPGLLRGQCQPPAGTGAALPAHRFSTRLSR